MSDPFRLTQPPGNVCPNCDRTVRNMARHRGSDVCARATFERFRNRLGYEQFGDDPEVFRQAELPCVVLRRGRSVAYHSDAWAVRANAALRRAGVSAARRVEVLRLGEGSAELERELAVAAMAQQTPVDATERFEAA